MPRASRYDDDQDRLPHGMTRVGYDADTQVYTFQDVDGSYWESAPGCQYGQLSRVGREPAQEESDVTDPFLSVDNPDQGPSWRADMMPLLNFGLLIGLFLLVLFWFMNRSAPSDTQHVGACAGRSLVVHKGDSCWALAKDEGITVEEILGHNLGLDCSRLTVGSKICLSG